jgi:hypothetical protein
MFSQMLLGNNNQRLSFGPGFLKPLEICGRHLFPVFDLEKMETPAFLRYKVDFPWSLSVETVAISPEDMYADHGFHQL